MSPTRALSVSLAVLICGLLAGCGEEATITLSYDRPAAYDIPQTVRKIAIAEFGGKSAEDRKWGDVASDKLAAKMDDYNRAFDRYQLVDRKRLAALMDERDFQIATSSDASRAGKIAKVDAMIYGNVTTTTREEDIVKKVFDPFSRSIVEKSVRRQYAATTTARRTTRAPWASSRRWWASAAGRTPPSTRS